ncbi:cobyrinate a,c-diamide synthase [Lachnospiraceae bacterium CLA-AA-H185]|uniref:Cobyrinate a,c-diamide synthase n=1 Tax=Maccoyibacter intestinihominis TaxID=3133499 RepID=A0ABV1HC15_9FIRM
MKLDRVMIAAPKSGSGKTTITCAILQTLKDMGKQVVSYKCGPDYIDPMFHQRVIGIPSKNLDTFFTGENDTRKLLLKNRTGEEIAVIEGVMGLYDGLGGVREEGSSYHLAKVTKTPIILVVDAKGMGRSVIPLIAGFLAYDTEHLIRGVILNRMSKSYYEIIKPLIETELQIRVLGYLAERQQLQIQSRHLGLHLPGEIKEIQRQLEVAAEELQKSVSIETIIQIAASAETIEIEKITETTEKITSTELITKPLIAVARDEAFCFYYEDNLLLLKEYGADIAYFSPLHDKELPEGSSGLLLGGGYPELYAKELEENTAMRKEIKAAVESGMPVVAECGGFLYLHTAIRDRDGHPYQMAGVLPAACQDTKKLVRFGYIELEEKESNFLEVGTRIKGHEFHYFDSEKNGEDCIAIKPVTGRTYPCVIEKENVWMGFPHLYYPSNPSFADHFVKKAEQYLGGKYGEFLSFF